MGGGLVLQPHVMQANKVQGITCLFSPNQKLLQIPGEKTSHLPGIIFCSCHFAAHHFKSLCHLAFFQEMFILGEEFGDNGIGGQCRANQTWNSVKQVDQGIWPMSHLLSKANVQVIVPRDEPTMPGWVGSVSNKVRAKKVTWQCQGWSLLTSSKALRAEQMHSIWPWIWGSLSG